MNESNGHLWVVMINSVKINSNVQRSVTRALKCEHLSTPNFFADISSASFVIYSDTLLLPDYGSVFAESQQNVRVQHSASQSIGTQATAPATSALSWDIDASKFPDTRISGPLSRTAFVGQNNCHESGCIGSSTFPCTSAILKLKFINTGNQLQ